MKPEIQRNAGFTLIELLIVLGILTITITFLYRFYHEAYQGHGDGARQEIARLQKTRVCMQYLEADLQRYGTAVTNRDSAGATELRLPETGMAAVRYRLEANGAVVRLAGTERLGLLDGVASLSLQPRPGSPGLYRLQLAFVDPPAVHSTLAAVDRVIGFPMVKGGATSGTKP